MRSLMSSAPPRPSLHVVHGVELQRTLDARAHNRTIKFLGSVIVGLSVVLAYLWEWADKAGLQ